MKYLFYLLAVIVVLFVISQIWSKGQTKNIEMYPYEVMESYDGFEVRKYEEANFAYVTMDAKSYQDGSGKGFGQLAGYIFGGNAEKEKIAMTSPVEMIMDEKMTMKFMVPAQYKIEDMPKPDNANVKFQKEPSKVMAAIRFGGFANDEKIEKHKDKLFSLLDEEGISYKGQWSYMGYNPPFDLINRRNEIVVELDR